MQQISMPLRIALVGALVLAVAWLAVLRPKAGDGPAAPASAPGVQGLGNAVDAAQGAVSTSADANAKVAAASASAAAASSTATGSAAATAHGDTAAGASGPTAPAKAAATAAHASPASRAASTKRRASAKRASAATPTRRAVTTHDRSAALMSALAHGKTAVVLFYGRGSDDAHVRAAARHLARHRGRVVVRTAPLSSVASFSAITRGVQIDQGPTLLVIGPDRKAREIVGYTDRPEIDQLVGDVIAGRA